MLSVLCLGATSLAVVPSAAQVGADPIPRCGDCWCIPEGGTEDGTCPTFEGIWQSFPAAWIDSFTSFELLASSPPLTLVAEGTDSADCYPFADSVGARPQNNYPESEAPQCKLSSSLSEDATTTAVCGYKYADEAASCRGRTYEIVSYESAVAAETDFAVVVHSGQCGVCSNAVDLAVRMNTIDSIADITAACAASYFVSTTAGARFGELTDCIQNAGFTTPCATLWAHFAATNAAVCSLACVSADNEQNFNGPPPMCELSECLACSNTLFEDDLNRLAGVYKSPWNAGFADAVATPCSAFTRIADLDPCQGLAPTISPAPSAMPLVPTPTSGTRVISNDFALVPIFAWLTWRHLYV
jgi:hypothetical protein